MGMVGLAKPGWCDHPAGALQPAHKAVSDGRLMGGTRNFTLLDGPAGASGMMRQGGGAVKLADGYWSLVLNVWGTTPLWGANNNWVGLTNFGDYQARAKVRASDVRLVFG